MFMTQRIALVSLSLLVAAPLLHAQQTAQQPLNNAAVLQLAASGTSEEQIVQTITASAGYYNLDSSALDALKEAGVTGKEVDAMRKKNEANAAAAAALGIVFPPGVHEIGVYYKDPAADTWIEFKPETFYYVNPKSTGSRLPIMGGDIGVPVALVLLPVEIAYAISHHQHNDHPQPNALNAYIAGKTAELALNRPVDILIYAPEDTEPKDYHLVKLRADPDKAEVRLFERGGTSYRAGASKRDLRTFKATKLGFRFYQFTLGPEYQPGEYGILLPDAAAPRNGVGKGEIRTFRVVE